MICLSNSLLYQLSKGSLLPKLTTAQTVRPAWLSLSKNGQFFSTSPKRKGDNNDELYQKSYSDAFDESDALEKGKEQAKEEKPVKTTKSTPAKVAGKKQLPSELMFRPFSLEGFDDVFSRDPFFAPFFTRTRGLDRMFDPLPVLRNFPFNPARSTLLRSSPGYEIKELDDGNYEIAMEIPDGVEASDIKVEMDGNYLHVSGSKKTENTTTRFEKRFAVGKNVDVNHVKANFADGTLVVTAPKLQIPTISIPITKKPHAISKEEVVQTNYSNAFDESDAVEVGKQAQKDEKKSA